MIPGVTWRKRAELDLSERVAYIAREAGADVAEKFAMAVYDSLARLADMPHIGASRHSEDPKIRELRFTVLHGFEDYLLFYKPTRDGLQVVRLLHAKQDYTRYI